MMSSKFVLVLGRVAWLGTVNMKYYKFFDFRKNAFGQLIPVFKDTPVGSSIAVPLTERSRGDCTVFQRQRRIAMTESDNDVP